MSPSIARRRPLVLAAAVATAGALGADAEITADVTRNGTTAQDVPLADVTVTRAMKDMETKLTKEAAEVFGSASYEGAAGDPLTVVQKTSPGTPSSSSSPSASASASSPGSQSPSASASQSASASASASTSASASASQNPSPSSSPSGGTTPSTSAAPAAGDIADGTLGWGVKESFRSYVVGAVAKGTITASGGAGQSSGNGAFTFVDATGTYDTDAGELSAAFRGAVNFKGHKENGEYGLDLTLSDLRPTLDGGTGELTADVTSLGEKSEDVVLADLEAAKSGLTATDDVITLNDIEATLTDSGAKAFGGFYTAGTALDPVDLSVALTADAQLPGGDGSGSSGGSAGGSGGSAGGSTGGVTGGVTGGAGSTTGGVTGGLASTGSAVPVAALGTAAAVTAAAGAGVVFAMRRRRTQA
ncbi:HtaA domain-containing protein [Streptomyces sp. M41]|uniref:HtaA domain-containing protein n=1 Tax=Streptomyces sp. M41 TaxID=3059412 RepID=UPI00374D158B